MSNPSPAPARPTGTRRLVPWPVALLVLAAIVAILVLAFTVHSPASSGSGSTTTTSVTGGTHAPGSELWSGDATLAINDNYSLVKLPPVPNTCLECIQVEEVWQYGIAISADGGMQRLPAGATATYEQCASLLAGKSLPAASLDVPGFNSGAKVGTWFCAYNDDGDILGMRYDGANTAGTAFQFHVVSWASTHAPF